MKSVNKKYKEIVELQSDINGLSVEDSIELSHLLFNGGRLDLVLHLLKVLKKIDDRMKENK